MNRIRGHVLYGNIWELPLSGEPPPADWLQSVCSPLTIQLTELLLEPGQCVMESAGYGGLIRLATFRIDCRESCLQVGKETCWIVPSSASWVR